jgi:hypothetical protein
MAGLRNLVLSLLRMAGATNIAQALRYWARQGLQCRCCASSVSGSPDPDPLTQGRLLFCAVALSGSIRSYSTPQFPLGPLSAALPLRQAAFSAPFPPFVQLLSCHPSTLA